jgi:hypothetical protein
MLFWGPERPCEQARAVLSKLVDYYIFCAKWLPMRYELHNKYNLKTLGPRAAQLMVELNERRQQIFSLADVQDITGLNPSSARSPRA